MVAGSGRLPFAGEGDDFVRAAPGEGKAGAAMTVIVDDGATIGEIFTLEAHLMAAGAEADLLGEDFGAAQLRSDGHRAFQDSGADGGVWSLVPIARFRQPAEDDVFAAVEDVGDAVDIALVEETGDGMGATTTVWPRRG